MKIHRSINSPKTVWDRFWHQVRSGTNLWKNFQFSEVYGDQNCRKGLVAQDYDCDYCQPQREVSLGKKDQCHHLAAVQIPTRRET